MNRISTFAVAFFASAVVFAAQAAEVRNIVIVHGALADGSSWRKATEILQDRGYNVTIVQQPITSLADDVAATNRVLDLQTGPTLLVGHSYGGMVISEAGKVLIPDRKSSDACTVRTTCAFLLALALAVTSTPGDPGTSGTESGSASGNTSVVELKVMRAWLPTFTLSDTDALWGPVTGGCPSRKASRNGS